MKINLESINWNEHQSSFRWLINPKLNDFYFWHFHPEYELVFIESAHGVRHVGDHKSEFYNSDLVFIGSNLPHLNFDYGIKTEYEKTVLHIRPDFFEGLESKLPELKSIQDLKLRAQKGIIFGEATKKKFGQQFKSIYKLPPFEQFLQLISMFHHLAITDDFTLMHNYHPKIQSKNKDLERISRILEFIEVNYQRKIELEEMAILVNLSTPAFCRYFKKMTKLNFITYLNTYRINKAKEVLRSGQNISETAYDCGFESLSYFTTTFKKITGTSPGKWLTIN